MLPVPNESATCTPIIPCKLPLVVLMKHARSPVMDSISNYFLRWPVIVLRHKSPLPGSPKSSSISFSKCPFFSLIPRFGFTYTLRFKGLLLYKYVCEISCVHIVNRKISAINIIKLKLCCLTLKELWTIMFFSESSCHWTTSMDL